MSPSPTRGHLDTLNYFCGRLKFYRYDPSWVPQFSLALFTPLARATRGRNIFHNFSCSAHFLFTWQSQAKQTVRWGPNSIKEKSTFESTTRILPLPSSIIWRSGFLFFKASPGGECLSYFSFYTSRWALIFLVALSSSLWGKMAMRQPSPSPFGRRASFGMVGELLSL